MTAQEGPKWTEVLKDRLSPSAVEALDRVDARREPSLLCDPVLLRREVEDRRLPVFDSVLEYEGSIGSVMETLRLHDDRVNQRHPLTTDTLPHYGASLLFPIGLWSDPFAEGEPEDGLFDYLMDERGTCYVKQRLNMACTPIAESYLVQVEQYAALIEVNEMIAGRRPFVRWRHHVRIYYQNIARELGEALNVRVNAAATDKYSGVCSNEDFLVSYFRRNLGGDETSVRLTHIDDVAQVIRATYRLRPNSVVTWWGEQGAPPSVGEPIVERFPAYGFRGVQDGEFLLIGHAGARRLHWRQFERGAS